MKLDVIDVFKNVAETILGRLLLVFLVVNLSASIAMMIRSEDDIGILPCIFLSVPLMFMTLIGGLGLITLPLIFAYTFAFLRFDMHLSTLAIPAVLAYLTLHFPYL